MRRSFALLAAVMIAAAALPRAALGSPALFTSDRGYFSPSFDAARQEDVNANRVVYETMGEDGLASLVRGVLGLDGSSAADAPASLLPAWVNADELAREPPEVVFVYQGAQRAVGADLAAAGVAEAVKKVLGGAAGANDAGVTAGRSKTAGGSSVTAPHAGLYGGDAATYSPTASSGEDASGALASRVLSALGDAKRSGAAKAGGRHFVAGACKGPGLVSGWEAQNQQEAEAGAEESSAWWLKPGDELADFMRRRSGADGTPTAAADVVVICAPSTDAASASPSAAEEEQRARLVSLGDEVGSFAAFVEGLREGGVRHAAVYAAASTSASAAASSSSSMKTCLGDLAAKALTEEGHTAGEGGGRALLFAGAASPPPAVPPYVCDDLCKLQTNIVTGLIFFWTVLLCILFGYALMHNLDTPSRFEKSKEETDR